MTFVFFLFRSQLAPWTVPNLLYLANKIYAVRLWTFAFIAKLMQKKGCNGQILNKDLASRQNHH
jgi:hypothetical protein